MDTILSAIFGLIMYTWWIIVPVLLFLAFQRWRRRQWVEQQKYVLLKVSVPKENEKAPVAAEQMFAAIHGLHRDSRSRFFEGSMQEHVSFEIASQDQRINFYAYVPEAQKSFVEGQIYAQYPKAVISPVEDYVHPETLRGKSLAETELKMTNKDVYPIKTFLNFEDVDPLSGITAVLGDLAEGEEVWVQILARPVDDRWHQRGESELKALQAGRKSGGAAVFGGVGKFAGELFSAATAPPAPAAGGGKPQAPPPVQVDEALSSGLREKGAKLGYETKIRIVAVSTSPAQARNRLNAAIGAFKQFNTTNLNGFTAGKIITKEDKIVPAYRARLFMDHGPILNIEELASVFHLPNVSVETPTISWTASSQGEPPENLPVAGTEKDLSVFAETRFRDKITRFGLKEDDRRRHVYAIGKTGMGKTNMLENMVLSDMQAGRGLAVVDPHGDFIETVLDHVPASRVDDVIVFNPADRDFPIAFNILEKVDRDAKPLVASGVVGIFEKIYGHSWGPRLEHILRNSILALLDYPDSTLLDIPRLLANQKFRDQVIPHIQDTVVREFWTQEFAGYSDRQRTEAIAPIQNKVGQFLGSTTIRNIVGQKHTSVDMRKVMDEGKILLMKLSKGELGEDSAALLGAMMITKIQLAAMGRANVAESERRDFYLYVDEFQNFATESFGSILSEARKYRLNMAMANQYIAQMPDEVRDAVFGNVGTIISFRVGANDADWLAKEFEPVFEATDIVNLDKYHIYLKLAIDGVTGSAFSATTIPLPQETTPYRDKAIEHTRSLYASDRDAVESEIEAGSPAAAQAADEDKKRRFQSYLDKERAFAEQNATKPQAAPQQPAPATEKRTSTPAATGEARPSSPARRNNSKGQRTPRPESQSKSQPKQNRPRNQQKGVSASNRQPGAPAQPKPQSKPVTSQSEPQKPESARPQAPETAPQPVPQSQPTPAPSKPTTGQELSEDTIIKF
jgi:hypothetical protein